MFRARSGTDRSTCDSDGSIAPVMSSRCRFRLALMDIRACLATASVSACAVQADGGVVASGSFPGHAGIGRLLPDGTLDEAFATQVNGLVRGIGIRSDGLPVLSGEFSTINGTTRRGLGRLLADGALDSRFVAGVEEGGAYAAVPIHGDGITFVGGDFLNRERQNPAVLGFGPQIANQFEALTSGDVDEDHIRTKARDLLTSIRAVGGCAEDKEP